jgi:ribosomal protein S18 acetylase RimI-like enzyme
MQLADHAVYQRIAELHIAGIHRGFLSTLGPEFLALMYRAIDEGPDSVLLVARDGPRIVGFIAGATSMRQIYKRMLRRTWRLAWSLRRVLLSPKRMLKILEILRYSGGAGPHPSLHLPHAELLSIAVAEEARGSGCAQRLYEDLKAAFMQRGLSGFRIVVGCELTPAHRFYRKMGAVPVGEFMLHKGQSSLIYIQDTGASTAKLTKSPHFAKD